MKIDCDIIADLMPLYVEEIACEKSRVLIEQHVSECERCEKKLQEMKGEEIKVSYSTDSMEVFRKIYRKHNLFISAVSIYLTLATIILVWGMFFLEPGNEMGYCLLSNYLFLPAGGIVTTIILGRRNLVQALLGILLFSTVNWLLPLWVFGATNLMYVLVIVVPAGIALLIARVFKAFKRRKRAS